MNSNATTAFNYRDQLESERLITRFLEPADAEAWEEFMTDKDAVEFFPLSFFSGSENPSVQWINRQLKRYQENRFGLQALLDKNTGELIGQCGLLKQEVDGKTETEVGYHIFKKHWGKGYAPEAARLFINYTFENSISPSVISIIDVNNLKSQRVAEKNGLTREKQTAWNGLNVFIYRIRQPK